MRATRVTWIWALAAAAALLYPDHISSAFDGVPLDRGAEALIVGGVVPALWWFYPRFLGTLAARVVIVALIVWRLASSALFVQDGWCVRFQPAGVASRRWRNARQISTARIQVTKKSATIA